MGRGGHSCVLEISCCRPSAMSGVLLRGSLRSLGNAGHIMAAKMGAIGAQRSAVTFIASYEDTRQSMKFFGNHLNKCGSDEYPGFRKEYMKPKEKRYRRNKARLGKQANYKVRGLVEFINFKRANKYS